ncbi:hypothetical protein QE152_g35797 [Popillia japonica]|uniref:Uncharacterized protein n=1 Tax=Popillia japonica TaxID=7064 RepID=A0AAW1IF85_POPJA
MNTRYLRHRQTFLADADIPNDIIILPHDNTNNENTDEDSGDDKHILINNLPADRSRAAAEVLVHENNESDSEDDIPLSI